MKIAVLAPTRPDIYEIRRIRDLCLNLLSAGSSMGHKLEITLGLSAGSRPAALSALRSGLPAAVLGRTFQWEAIPAANAARMFPVLDFNYASISNVYVPRDWGWNFRDADMWIVPSDTSVGAILPLKPTLLMVRDLAERYIVGHDFESSNRIERFLSWRQVRSALVYDSNLIGDLVSFVGMQSRKTFLFGPMVPTAACEELQDDYFKSDVFCFSTFRDEATLRTASEGVLHFVQRDPRTSVLIGFDGFSDPPDDVADRIRRFVASIPAHHQGAIRTHRFENEFEWNQAMLGSRVVMSPRMYPGEPDDLLTAMAFSKPFVGLGTPQSRKISEIIEDSVFLYGTTDACDVGGELAKAFLAARRMEGTDQGKYNYVDWLQRMRSDALASTIAAIRMIVGAENASGADDVR